MSSCRLIGTVELPGIAGQLASPWPLTRILLAGRLAWLIGLTGRTARHRRTRIADVVKAGIGPQQDRHLGRLRRRVRGAAPNDARAAAQDQDHICGSWGSYGCDPLTQP